MYVSSMYHPKTTVLERAFQSDRLNCLIATVPPEEEVLGLKEAASVLEDKTDRRRPRATVPKQPFQSNRPRSTISEQRDHCVIVQCRGES